jgi:hypothetical protein
MTRASALTRVQELIRYKRLGISLGNIKALAFLGLLGAVSALLVVAIILVPLVRSGLPEMDRWGFAQAVSYFALIGLGFMLVQIPYMQRFSIYLGHPAYAIAVILFSMILFTGVGSCVSDRLPIEAQPGWLFAVPLAIAAMILGVSLAIQPIIDTTIYLGLSIRCAVVVALVAPVALLLGLCFPIGMRLVGRISGEATAWVWGINGACGVLASALAVALSIFIGIHASLYLAAALYAALLVPALLLWRRGG